jgi:hypothetical protein
VSERDDALSAALRRRRRPTTAIAPVTTHIPPRQIRMPAAGNSHCIVAPLAVTAVERQRPRTSERAATPLPGRMMS